MKKPAITIDQGPAERRQHNRVVAEQGANMRVRLRVVDQTEIDRLLYERLISLDQHTAGNHLYRDMIKAGYFMSPRWFSDVGIGSDPQGISQDKASALLKMGLARAWLLAGVGRRCTEYLLGVVLGERIVQDREVSVVRTGLDKYQGFDSWWQGRDAQTPLPELLADLPGRIRRTRPFHHEV